MQDGKEKGKGRGRTVEEKGKGMRGEGETLDWIESADASHHQKYFTSPKIQKTLTEGQTKLIACYFESEI